MRRLYGDEEYIFNAFRWARETCPEMKLYYNDHLIDWGVKSERKLTLVQPLANEGLIDGVGFQSHLDRHPKLRQFAAVMDLAVELGLGFSTSELELRLPKP